MPDSDFGAGGRLVRAFFLFVCFKMQSQSFSDFILIFIDELCSMRFYEQFTSTSMYPYLKAFS